ncbi:MAG: hypothetical protein KDD12_20755 [Lewinella sp.]|nr:hypothetical protein [Lewinella sp.]
MKVRLNETNGAEEPQPAAKMLDWTGRLYQSFLRYVELRDDDPIWMMGYKLTFRFVGIVFMLILSPFVVLGLLFAFAAVF